MSVARLLDHGETAGRQPAALRRRPLAAALWIVVLIVAPLVFAYVLGW